MSTISAMMKSIIAVLIVCLFVRESDSTLIACSSTLNACVIDQAQTAVGANTISDITKLSQDTLNNVCGNDTALQSYLDQIKCMKQVLGGAQCSDVPSLSGLNDMLDASKTKDAMEYTCRNKEAIDRFLKCLTQDGTIIFNQCVQKGSEQLVKHSKEMIDAGQTPSYSEIFCKGYNIAFHCMDTSLPSCQQSDINIAKEASKKSLSDTCNQFLSGAANKGINGVLVLFMSLILALVMV